MSEVISLEEAHRRIAEARRSDAPQLDLSGCELISDLGPLSGLSALAHLNLRGCRLIRGLGPLSGLTALAHLTLNGCGSIRDLGPLSGLTALTHLDLSSCGSISDLGPLSGLPSLAHLDLGWCGSISDLGPLSGLSALAHLDLGNCGSISDLGPLSGLASLTCLDLGWCESISDLGPLSGLSALTDLDLGDSESISDLGPLSGLPSLARLDLGWCELISDLGPLSGLSALAHLDLRGCRLIRGLGPLSGLTALAHLTLNGCGSISDLGPLSGLTALAQLDLSGCGSISDLGPLSDLMALAHLDLSECGSISDLGPLSGLSLRLLRVRTTAVSAVPVWFFGHPCLESVLADTFQDVPAEVQSKSDDDNCLPRLRAWWRDTKVEAGREAEVKIFLLGNGGVGKTQMCRTLQGLPFDESVATTHGVQLATLPKGALPLEANAILNVWDFGGQDIYHGTHALFLKSHAVFLVLWTPELEVAGAYTEGGLEMRHRPLAYWMDYVWQLAGEESTVLIVQSRCEERAAEERVPEWLLAGRRGGRTLSFSARTGRGAHGLFGAIRDAVVDLEARHPPPAIGKGWIAVRDELRRLLREESLRTMEGIEFDALCQKQCRADGERLVSDPDTLLEYLHRAGVVFHRETLFGGKVILDQGWALEAIYTVFDRQRTLPWLRDDGSFTRRDLDRLAWGEIRRLHGEGPFSTEEQELFLSMMESCGICFRWRKNAQGETVWLAPELLPTRDAARDRLVGRLDESQEPRQRILYHYRFLHEGLVRSLLSTVGKEAKDVAVYWRNGLWLYESRTHSYAVVEAREAPSEEAPGSGFLELAVYGEQIETLAGMLHEIIERLDPPPSSIEREAKFQSAVAHELEEGVIQPLSGARFQAPAPAPRGAKPAVFITYAWGDETPAGRERAAVVEGVSQRLDAEGFDVQRDNRVMRNGDSIRAFMKNFGAADHIVAVISDKYLRSPYCMAELHSVWQSCNGNPDAFRRRVHPLILEDAQVGSRTGRLERARHWKAEQMAMEADQRELAGAFGIEDQRELQFVTEFALHVSDMLRWLNDVLMPHGFEDIQADNFNAVVQILRMGG